MELTDLMTPRDLLAMKKVLVVYPHADDSEVGAGGTLARMIHLGADVQYVTVADDRAGSRHPDIYPGQLAKIRVQEQEAGMRVLGVSSDRRLGWRDSEVLAP